MQRTNTAIRVSWKVKRELDVRQAAMAAEYERPVTFDEVLRILLARDAERREQEAAS